ncbi:Pentatricopeptide repeat-containing protein [Acorus calamus]|uniref:Pentatricopeptide repeat-containing protein n=1 Tax=Acorus calamus TaxID=4465 RepID=A0AAV9DJR2_ACOCL|nr:Pentatricopeptide repeat-containing protein [Acorus calamus]
MPPHHLLKPHHHPLSTTTDHHLLRRLDHHDWLSPTETLTLFSNLTDPKSIPPFLSKLSLRNDYRPSEPLYTAILSRLRDHPSIDSLLLRARRERLPLSDPFFHKLIKTQSPDRALHTLSRMPSDFHCFPSVKTFNLVLAALVSARRYDSVRALLCALAPRLGVTPDTCSFNILIKGLCASDRRDDALALLDEMPKPNRVTYATLMHFLCARGEVAESFALLQRMERERCEPDTVVFNVLISGVCKRGRVDEAMGMLRGMMRWGCRPNSDSYQAVLCGLIGARRFGEAKVFVVEEMGRERGRRPSFKAYELVVAGLCGEGRVGDAEVVLRRMVRDGFVPRWGTWRVMIKCLCLDMKSCSSELYSVSE